jgi:uncharacterized DUF497 family protein
MHESTRRWVSMAQLMRLSRKHAKTKGRSFGRTFSTYVVNRRRRTAFRWLFDSINTAQDETCRLISVRKANMREQRKWL